MSENIQCPYCLNETEYEDSVYDGEEIEWECPDCEKSSIHTADVRITFTAQSDCEANNEEHAFVKSLARSSTENNYYVYVCKKCDVVTSDSDLVPRMSVREQVVVG